MGRQISENTSPRNAALYEAYRKALGGSDIISQKEAVIRAINTPQPRFWVSFTSVYRTLLEMISKGHPPCKRSSKKKLAKEIWDAYLRIKDKRVFRNASTYFIASFIVYEQSSGFYISYSHARRMIYDEWQKRKSRHTSDR